MWPFGRNPRFVKYLNDPVVGRAAEKSFRSKRSFARFLLRFSEAQAQRVIEAYINQTGPTRYDPIEDSVEHSEVFADVERELASLYSVRRRGMCHTVWRKKKLLLRSRGVDWISPADLNPYHRFD